MREHRELPDISRHVETFVTALFDSFTTERGGAEYCLPCPFCSGEAVTPKKKLYLNRKTGQWICFKCEKKGGFSWLVRQMAKADSDINPKEYLSGIEEHGADDEKLSLFSWAARHPERAAARARVAKALPKGLIPVWQPHDVPVAERRRLKALDYLSHRGISMQLAEFYGVHAGVVGKYEGRVAVPVLSAETREVVGWVCRATAPLMAPKVLNTPSEDGLSIDDHLFSLDKAIGIYKDVVLVEGVFDAMKHGPNFLALLGKALKKGQFLALLRAKFARVTVCLDRDAHDDCRVLARSLKMHVPEVRYVLFREGKDPGAVGRDQMALALSQSRLA